MGHLNSVPANVMSYPWQVQGCVILVGQALAQRGSWGTSAGHVPSLCKCFGPRPRGAIAYLVQLTSQCIVIGRRRPWREPGFSPWPGVSPCHLGKPAPLELGFNPRPWCPLRATLRLLIDQIARLVGFVIGSRQHSQLSSLSWRPFFRTQGLF